VYCSINPFLAGEVMVRATGRSFPDLAWELLASSLQFDRHFLLITPVGDSYMGGGAHYFLRDFAKLVLDLVIATSAGTMPTRGVSTLCASGSPSIFCPHWSDSPGCAVLPGREPPHASAIEDPRTLHRGVRRVVIQ